MSFSPNMLGEIGAMNGLKGMISMIEAFPELFNHLTENIYWAEISDSLAKSKTERENKTPKHYKFISQNWNKDFKQFPIKHADGDYMITMTRRRHIRCNMKHIGKHYWLHKQIPPERTIRSLMCSTWNIVIAVDNPKGIYLNHVNSQVYDNINQVQEIEGNNKSDCPIKMLELMQMREKPIYKMHAFNDYVLFLSDDNLHLYTCQYDPTANLAQIIFEPIIIPKDLQTDPDDVTSDNSERIINIEFAENEAGGIYNPARGMGLGNEKGIITRTHSSCTHAQYIVTTPTRQFECFIGYFSNTSSRIYILSDPDDQPEDDEKNDDEHGKDWLSLYGMTGYD